MSNLPRGWQIRTLGETCDILAGFGFPERLQGKTSGDFPFYKVGDISETWKRGDVYLTTANHYLNRGEATEIRAKPLPKNTTVFAKIGAAIALNRRAILSEPSLVDNNVMGLHPSNEGIDHKFLFHFICTVKLDELSRATTVPSVRKSDIERIEIPIPPLPDQRRIVAEIEKQFTRLDAGVAALRRVQANLKRYRAAVLKAACEGSLVPTEAELARSKALFGGSAPCGTRSVGSSPDDRPTKVTGSSPVRSTHYESGEQLLQRILTERRQKWKGWKKYNEPAAPESASLFPLPEGWAWTSVDQLGDVGTGATPKRGKSEYYEGGDIPWVTSSALNQVFVDSANELVTKKALAETNLTVFPVGTLLVAMYGEGRTRGKCAELRIDATTNQAIAAIQCASEVRGYLKLSLWRQYESMRLAASGGVQPNLNLSLVRGIRIPLPPLAEQTRIVAEVERRLSVVEELETLVQTNLQRATRLRQSILQKAFTGVLTLNDRS